MVREIIVADHGLSDHVIFDHSYGEGGDGEDTHSGCSWTYSAVTNNALSTNRKDYGSGFIQQNAGNVWSGNYSVDANTGAGSASTTPIANPQGPTCG